MQYLQQEYHCQRDHIQNDITCLWHDLFSCGARACNCSLDQTIEFLSWFTAVYASIDQLLYTRCDYCFLLAPVKEVLGIYFTQQKNVEVLFCKTIRNTIYKAIFCSNNNPLLYLSGSDVYLFQNILHSLSWSFLSLPSLLFWRCIALRLQWLEVFFFYLRTTATCFICNQCRSHLFIALSCSQPSKTSKISSPTDNWEVLLWNDQR